jgi:hypothetical protein
VCRLHPDDVARLAVRAGDIVELVGASVPLRAWVVLDASLTRGRVLLDARARRVLGVDDGAALEIRALDSSHTLDSSRT